MDLDKLIIWIAIASFVIAIGTGTILSSFTDLTTEELLVFDVDVVCLIADGGDCVTTPLSIVAEEFEDDTFSSYIFTILLYFIALLIAVLVILTLLKVLPGG